MNASSIFRRVVLPGLLFQSVMIGGGYATGRELVEFFLTLGYPAAFVSLAVACFGFSLVAMLSFEFARMVRGFDYRHFFKELIGPFWIVFEIAYLVLGLLVLAVVGAAAGEMVALQFGLPRIAGTASLMVLICVLVLYGTAMIEKALSVWSAVLYVVYAVFIVLFFKRFGISVAADLPASNVTFEPVARGAQYLGYNIASLPVILFCVKHMTSRRDAFVAGALLGPIALIPGSMFLLMMAAIGPPILDAALPADFLLQRLGYPVLTAVFYLTVFGTLVETGTAYIHAFNERIAAARAEQGQVLHKWARPAVALAVLVIATVLADKFGIIQLIARGYGTLTWVFLLVFVAPVLTIAVRRIWRSSRG